MDTRCLPKPVVSAFAFLLSILLLLTPLSACVNSAEAINRTQQSSQACADAERQASNDISGGTWFVVGCLAGVIGWVIALVTEPNPPAAALVGKSQEYVAIYTDCYRNKGSSIKRNNALTGCLVGTGITVAIYSLLIVAASESGY